MKIKNIVSIIVFMLIITWLTSKITWIFRGNYLGSRECITEFGNEGNIDVVFIGGSNWVCYFSPLDAFNQAGMVSYDYATMAGPFDLYKYYLEDAKKKSPQLFVIDIRTLKNVRDEIGVSEDYTLRNWSDSMPIMSGIRLKGISSYLFKHNNWKDLDVPSFYLDISRYHDNRVALAQQGQWEYCNAKKIDENKKGYAPYVDAYPLPTPKHYDVKTVLSDVQYNALSDLLDYCDTIDSQVLFVLGPYMIHYGDWGIMNEAEDIIKGRGYEFVNFNNNYDEIGLDFETDFYNTTHVNYVGSLKYTEYLVNYLINHYQIPDRRNDVSYNQWKNEYLEYKEASLSWEDIVEKRVISYLQARDVDAAVRDIEDFDTWYSMIRNDNFTVIIKKNGVVDESKAPKRYLLFADKYKIDNSEEYYLEAWIGNKCISDIDDGKCLDAIIPLFDNGLGQYKCKGEIGRESELIIADSNYNFGDDLQVIVVDNNYLTVIDNVGLEFDEEADEIRINRHELNDDALFTDGALWNIATRVPEGM